SADVVVLHLELRSIPWRSEGSKKIVRTPRGCNRVERFLFCFGLDVGITVSRRSIHTFCLRGQHSVGSVAHPGVPPELEERQFLLVQSFPALDDVRVARLVCLSILGRAPIANASRTLTVSSPVVLSRQRVNKN